MLSFRGGLDSCCDDDEDDKGVTVGDVNKLRLVFLKSLSVHVLVSCLPGVRDQIEQT